MRRILIAVLALGLATWVPAQEPGGSGNAAAPPDYRKLVDEYDAASAKSTAEMKAVMASDAYKKAVEAKDRKAIDELRAKVTPVDRASFATRAMKLADAAKGDERARYLVWTAQNADAKTLGNDAFAKLVADHAASPMILDLFEGGAGNFHYRVTTFDEAKASERMMKLESANPLPMVKAWALYAESLRLSRDKKATDEAKAKADELSARAEKLAAGTLLGDKIGGPTYEKEHLQIGMVAPEITADDLNGKPMKLSDFRGKVVVIDFWGDW